MGAHKPHTNADSAALVLPAPAAAAAAFDRRSASGDFGPTGNDPRPSTNTTVTTAANTINLPSINENQVLPAAALSEPDAVDEHKQDQKPSPLPPQSPPPPTVVVKADPALHHNIDRLGPLSNAIGTSTPLAAAVLPTLPSSPRPDGPPRRQSLLPNRQTTLIRTLLDAAQTNHEADPSAVEALLPINGNMVTRKVWVRRPGASPTLITINEDDLVDDVRDMILRKYANSLGRHFDSPDLTLRICPREQRQDRLLGPEEPMGRTLDAYFPGGQTVDEALVIDIPSRRTPRPSPRAPTHATAVYYADEAGILNGGVPPINVLIVEDNPINLKLLEAFVKRLKVRWKTAVNGRDAVSMWRTGGFHLVLMDIQLPIMSGLDATREIRRLERVNSIGVFSSSASSVPELTNGELEEKDRLTNMELFKSPVIIVALTASSLQSDRHEALAAGCNDFLTKPVNFVWLERKVMEWGCMQALIDFDGWRRSQSVLSEELREEIYHRVKTSKHSLKTVSSSLGVDVRRVAAVVRMKEMEKQWVAEKKQLATPYAKAVLGMLPQTILRKEAQIPHEPINEIHVHKLTMQQLFVPVSESRQFNREDAAKAFHRNMLSADQRSPLKELVTMRKSIDSGVKPAEAFEKFKETTRAEEDRLIEKERRRLEKAEEETTRVDTGRFEFRFKEMNVEAAGKDGRGRKAVGWRYGVPFYDRKKGEFKLPTSVP
ncbi:hypothetical protein K4K61_005919 [Colletotrichum sp. SAR11_59]|nr:hypothetical protein K4K61_005919 [Colletotrichum sp. SAR11_59]